MNKLKLPTQYHKHLPLLALISITLILWLLSLTSISRTFSNPYTAIAKISGFLGFVFLTWNLVLATRLKIIERIYHGLDRVYAQHRLMGRLVIVFILLHPVLFIIRDLPSWQIVRFYVLPSSILSYNAAIYAVYTILFIIFFTVTNYLPYHIWKRLHQLIGIPYFLIGYHILTVGSDVSRYLPLKIWIIALFTVGSLAYLYKLLLYDKIGPHVKAQVAKVNPKGQVTELHLKPQHPFQFQPGQFVFIKVENSTVSSESHPFTISSAPHQSKLRISAKGLGDYTKQLDQIKPGTKVTVYGPYGTFGVPFTNTQQETVLIAGGIGITPFLSFLNHAAHIKDTRPIRVFYSVKDKAEGVYASELKRLVNKIPNAQLEIILTSQHGRLNIKQILPKKVTNHPGHFFLCGPQPMVNAFKHQLTSLGIPSTQIHYELFKFK